MTAEDWEAMVEWMETVEDVQVAQQAFERMKAAGGDRKQAGWEPARYETPPTEWAMLHGFESAEHHEWRYWRTQTEQEQAASMIEMEHMAVQGCQAAQKTQQPTRDGDGDPGAGGSVQKITHEHLLIAHKPFSR